MIEEILPSWVATAAFFGDDPAGWLWPAEAALVERAVGSRVREFTTGRMCARRALAQLGVETGPILSGPQREALWPEGVTGSITHCTGYRAAAVARKDEILALGIDAEVDSPLPTGLLKLIAVEGERAWLAQQRGSEHWDQMLFSAKESVYKALFPITGCWLDFTDVQVTIVPTNQSFAATVRPGVNMCMRVPPQLQGRYMRRNGLILTALFLPSARRMR